DFEQLRAVGVLSAPVPEAMGGLWESVADSTRPVCATLRTLAAADPPAALASSTHPSAIGVWLPPVAASNPSWVEQRDAIRATARGTGRLDCACSPSGTAWGWPPPRATP